MPRMKKAAQATNVPVSEATNVPAEAPKAKRKPRTPKAPATPSTELEELRLQNAELRRMVESQATHSQALLNAAGLKHGAVMSGGDLWVGVRNIGGTTVGFKSPLPGEGDIQLNSAWGGSDAGSVAVISYAAWQRVRKSRLYGNGHIIRDDSVLGTSHRAAPADRPEDLHPDHLKNAILDYQEFIEHTPEKKLRTRIAEMTSEETLRRLWSEVDFQIARERDKYPRDLAGDPHDEKRNIRALRDLPAVYQLVEQLVQARLEELHALEVARAAK